MDKKYLWSNDLIYALVAQSGLRHLTVDQEIIGSNPFGGAKSDMLSPPDIYDSKQPP